MGVASWELLMAVIGKFLLDREEEDEEEEEEEAGEEEEEEGTSDSCSGPRAPGLGVLGRPGGFFDRLGIVLGPSWLLGCLGPPTRSPKGPKRAPRGFGVPSTSEIASRVMVVQGFTDLESKVSSRKCSERPLGHKTA